MGRLRNITIFLLLGASSVVEARSPNETDFVGWQAQPKGRGTFGLLVNCLITLFLCVWTTIPVNIEPQALRNRALSRLFPSLEDKKIDRWLAKRWIRKSGWSVVSLVFPEVPLAIAMFETKTADMLKEQMLADSMKQGKSNKEWEDWKERWDDLALSYFVIMGGFRVGLEQEVTGEVNTEHAGPARETTEETTAIQEAGVLPPGDSLQPNSQGFPSPKPSAASQIEDIHQSEPAEEAIPAGEAIPVGEVIPAEEAIPAEEPNPNTQEASYHSSSEQNPPSSQDLANNPDDEDFEMTVGCTLTPHGVLFLAQQEGGFRNGLLPSQVKDRSKAGTLAKVIIVAQASWMAIQVLCRTATELTVAVLEVHVILHVLCSLCMYAIWWGKPVDIELQETVLVTKAQLEQLRRPPLRNPTNPFQVFPTDEESLHEKQTSSKPGTYHDGYLITRSGLGKLLYIQLCDKRSLFTEHFGVMRNVFRRLIDSRGNIWKEGLALTLIALAYGGAHLSTWNNKFASQFELWMWRSGAMLTAASMGCLVLSLYIGALLRALNNKTLEKYYSIAWGFCVGLGLIPVLFARIFLLVECFIALRSLPADSYSTVAWAETWPHFG